MTKKEAKRLEHLNTLPLKYSYKEDKGLPLASFDKNGVYFKVGQTVINHGNGEKWINTETDVLELNMGRIKQYSHLEVIAQERGI